MFNKRQDHDQGGKVWCKNGEKWSWQQRTENEFHQTTNFLALIPQDIF